MQDQKMRDWKMTDYNLTDQSSIWYVIGAGA